MIANNHYRKKPHFFFLKFSISKIFLKQIQKYLDSIEGMPDDDGAWAAHAARDEVQQHVRHR